MIVPLITVILLASLLPAQDDMANAKTKVDPIRGISITLPVYSGRPNPQWWLTEGPAYDTLVQLIRSLKAVPDTLFDYNEWNRPGYAIFQIYTREIKEFPKAINIWRNMAYIPQDGEKPPLYAKESARLYDFLVGQAEERGYKEFFVNYHKSREKKQ